MNDQHAWTEYAASYALGALDAEERAAFESHLAGCSLCRAEVQAYQEVAGSLAHAAPAAPLPPALKARVLEAARQVTPIGRIAKDSPPARASRVPWLLTAASLVLALGLGALYAMTRASRNELATRLVEVTDSAASTRTKLARLDSIVSVLLAADVETTGLAATGRPPSARLYHNRQRNVLVLAAFDLKRAPAGRTYQLWGIPGSGAPVSLGTFNTDADGRGVVMLAPPANAAFEVSAVTEEPAGGSPQPTTSPFLFGNWSQ